MARHPSGPVPPALHAASLVRLNLVERWFRITENDPRGSFRSVDELIEAVDHWSEHWDTTPIPSCGTAPRKRSSPQSVADEPPSTGHQSATDTSGWRVDDSRPPVVTYRRRELRSQSEEQTMPPPTRTTNGAVPPVVDRSLACRPRELWCVRRRTCGRASVAPRPAVGSR